ncbi:thioesterase family protein [Paraglaciecola aquimarina]|uniref:Thioesterase family protein n=1 Tax=Paraglaciecola algarum TaxID=3050085 RepID=A0ABS9DDX6_9ALTE|nr:thioesterase family protein [Paraglaciecola sp. G1-23]MCF2949959.1 thioesterase family protein [Paraglaciecola sp. G1-23]
MHIDSLFNSVAEQISPTKNTAKLIIPSSWGQGRTVYGGLSASLAYVAAKQVISPNKLLRSLHTSFIGPINVDKELTIEVEVLREGKNVTQVTTKVIQGNNTALISQASFGLARVSKIKIPDLHTHEMTEPEKPSFLPHIPKVTPKFLRHYQLAKVKGGLPFTGRKESDIHGWMRFEKPPAHFTDAHLVSLIDAWPPTILQMFKLPKMASTLSWNLEFIHPHLSIGENEWFAYQATTRQASDGYVHTEANIWDARNELLAISRQVVTVFG